MPKAELHFDDGAIAVTKAVLLVADRLSISQRVLASVIGLSEATISRMRKGAFAIDRRAGKALELALLLVQIYELLDRMVAGDEAAARGWLIAENAALSGCPIDLILSVRGLAEVLGYLRARVLL